MHCLSHEEFKRWLWQVGILQRAFPNSILKLDDVVYTTDEVDIHRLLSCTELRVSQSAPGVRHAGMAGISGPHLPLWAGSMAAACSSMWRSQALLGCWWQSLRWPCTSHRPT